jgi:2-polyprenyl-3-methyl-5-hydroxy-6-metoxy-1,4-benzoquinol methylase
MTTPGGGESALARHDRMVREEMEQAEAVRSTAGRPADFWQSLAGRFRAPVDRRPDPTADALAALLHPGDRVIDVGAGGGRLTVPLARRAREVVAVEPSPSMRGVLAEELARHGLTNVRVVAASWDEADVEPAEVVFAAHVTYGVRSIEPFVRKLDRLAARRAALVVMQDPPQGPLAPFWLAVHGQTRLRLPCRDELIDALRELGIDPAASSIGELPHLPFGPRQEALDLLRFRLLVGPGTPGDERLLAVVDELTEERDGQLYPRGAPPHQAWLLHWRPVRRAGA